MKEHPQFPWDPYSDQPYQMRDKRHKRKIYLYSTGQYLKALLLMPLAPLFMLSLRFKKQALGGQAKKVMGLSVHIESDCQGKEVVPLDKLRDMVNDLDAQQLLIRIPLADIDNLDRYIEHIDALSADDREIVVNLLQTRTLLDNREEQKAILIQVIEALRNKVQFIQVGNAYNRRKWAIRHFGEYYRFYRDVEGVTREYAPKITLIGGSIIDFEIPAFMESLFHFRPSRFQAYGAQLYVDRRGAPENKQMGFNFLSKINLISAMLQFSWKASGKLWITEFNWPLKETIPFAPCYGEALVDEQSQANFLARAYLIAMASGRVRTCYWHQLVAPGYGLVDNRGADIRKRPAYRAFKTLNALFQQAVIVGFHAGGFKEYKELWAVEVETIYEGEPKNLLALWSTGSDIKLFGFESDLQIDQNGDKRRADQVMVFGNSVTYIIH